MNERSRILIGPRLMIRGLPATVVGYDQSVAWPLWMVPHGMEEKRDRRAGSKLSGGASEFA
jgi:hypothetical protein